MHSQAEPGNERESPVAPAPSSGSTYGVVWRVAQCALFVYPVRGEAPDQ